STATTVSGQSRRQQPQQGAVGNPGPEDGNGQQVWQGEDVLPDGQGDQGDADDEGLGGAVHQMTGGCSCLREYEGVKRSVLKWAGCAYTAIMATQGMYETDLGTLGKCQLEVWKIGCTKYEVNPKMLPIGIGHIKNMNDWLVTWCRKSRDSVRQYIEVVFFREDWLANMIKARVKELKASGLHMKVPGREPDRASYSAITNEIEKNMIPEDEIMSNNPSEEEVSMWKDERAELDLQALNAQIPGTWGVDDELNGPQEGGPQDGPQEGGPQDRPQGDGLQDRPQEGGLQDRHNRDQVEQEGLDGEV
ncbi:hypothetical protein FRC11_000913, partial [Ceratobasidium sp. 423]